MMNVEKHVFKRKLKKLQDAAKPKMIKTNENGTAIENEQVGLFFFFLITSANVPFMNFQ